MQNDSDSDRDDDDYQSNKSKTKKPEYRIRNALKVPRATTYTAQALYDQIHSSDIDLEPDYQRDVVWPELKQINLIDSIFRNFYVPPVIFAVSVLDDGSEHRTCIDGKQRLTSIHRFMDGTIPHKDPETNDKLYYRDNGDSKHKRKLLPEKYRRLFANKQIVCVEYSDISGSDERDIFTRVQLGMALTPAEKIHVINTPRAMFIRTIVAEYCATTDGLKRSLAHLHWDRARGVDFRCLGQAIYCIEKYATAKYAGSIQQLEKWLKDESTPAQAFQDDIHNSFGVVVHLIEDDRTNTTMTKLGTKFAPVDVLMMCVLVHVHKNAFEMQQLAEAIHGMRAYARDKHQDIRLNDKITATMLEYIRAVKPAGVCRKPASSVVPLRVASTPLSKRKREEEEEGEERDELDSGDDRDPFDPESSPPRPLKKGKKGKNRETSTDMVIDIKPNISNQDTSTASRSLPPERMAAVRAAINTVPPHRISAPSSSPLDPPRPSTQGGTHLQWPSDNPQQFEHMNGHPQSHHANHVYSQQPAYNNHMPPPYPSQYPNGGHDPRHFAPAQPHAHERTHSPGRRDSSSSSHRHGWK